MFMFRVNLQSDDGAYLDIDDKVVVQKIVEKLRATGNEAPTVEYVPGEPRVTLVFSDGARIEADAAASGTSMDLAGLKGSEKFMDAKLVLYRAVPEDPPLPDTMCPC